MSFPSPVFSDNVRVKRGCQSRKDPEVYYPSEFFRVDCGPTDEYRPFEVSLSRYCVPGRIDEYCFDWVPSPAFGFGHRLRYFTDTGLTLGKAAAMVVADLERPQVVKMLADLCGTEEYIRYSRTLIHFLLPSFNVRSAACRACTAAFDAMMEKRKARLRLERAERVTT